MAYNILSYLENSAKKFTSKLAVTDGIDSFSYEELLNLSKRIGSELIEIKDKFFLDKTNEISFYEISCKIKSDTK